MKKSVGKKFIPLKLKNIQEAQRLLGRLEVALADLRKEVEAIRLESLRKNIAGSKSKRSK